MQGNERMMGRQRADVTGWVAARTLEGGDQWEGGRVALV